MNYVSTGDLRTRWKYTRQGINQLMKKTDFPEPIFYLNNGRLPVWELSDIEAFEKGKPELGDLSAKQSKMVGYYLARLKGEQQKKS